nr:hypothetical protein [Shewanella putrefaciens]
MTPLQLAQFNIAINALKDNGEITKVIHKWQLLSIAKQSNMSQQNYPINILYVSDF